MSLYLDIPYREKDEAKSLGAKWNPKVKKWYADCSPEEYVKFSKWLLKDYDEALIALDEIYIIEGHRKCWKCGSNTKVIGLGLNHLMRIFDGTYSDTGKPFYELYGDKYYELRLAWVESEEDIPPKLLTYLKNNYSVKTGFSKTINSNCFANHCDCCGALQGNWFLFNEPDSPLSSCCADEDELKERMEKLKIKVIPIYDDLQLYWSVGYCTADFGYYTYGNIEELILTDNKEDEEISYEELYHT